MSSQLISEDIPPQMKILKMQCVAQHINLCLVLVQPRKTRPNITDKLLTGTKRIKSIKQTNK